MSGNTETKKQDLGAWFKGSPGAKLPTPPAKQGAIATATAEKPASAGFFVDSSEIDREWEVGRHLVRITAAEDYTAASTGNESFKVRYLGLAGVMKGAGIDDYLPKSGKGLRKTHKACSAVDLVDENSNISIPGGAQQIVGRELWIDIERVMEPYNDPETGDKKTRARNKIAFTGYYHKNEFEVPKEGDPFTEGPLPAKTNGAASETVTVETAEGNVTAVAATGEVVGVEAGSAPPGF